MLHIARETPKRNIVKLLRECTVRICMPQKNSPDEPILRGTGFFVAPRQVLTCAHVVETCQSVIVRWSGETCAARVIDEYFLPDQSPDNEGPDLALLEVDIKRRHPCVYLDKEAEMDDELYTYGYTNNDPGGAPTRCTLEETTGDEKYPLLKFKNCEIPPGSSGSPILNLHTLYVCGLINQSRGRNTNLGGMGIPTAIVFQAIPKLQTLQQDFHREDRKWESYAKDWVTPYIHVKRRTFLMGAVLVVAGFAGLGGGWAVTQSGDEHPWIFRYTAHTTSVWSVAWSPDGKLVASAEAGRDINNETTVRIWEALTGNDEHVYRYRDAAIQQVAWSPDGASIALASRDGAAYIWNMFTRQTRPRVLGKPVDNDYVICIAWSPDGTRIATGHFDHTVKIWDAKDSHLIFSYSGHKDALRCLAWSPDSRYIASGSQNQDLIIQVWNAQTKELRSTYAGHVDSIQSITWSLDGQYIASASSDRTVQVWSPSTFIGQWMHTYRGHSNTVTSVAWSPNSQRIVSVSYDSYAHVWDAKDSSHVYIYNGHTDKLRSVSWAMKTNYIATSGDDTTVQIWQDKRP